MNDYYEVRIDVEPCSEDTTDVLAALLGDEAYESFVPDETGLTAYVKAEDYDAEAVDRAIAQLPFDCKSSWKATLVPGQDWNEEWEKHYFQPIVVDCDGESVAIHSSFHTDVPDAKYDIVIDPKMAFGTGHHDTTEQVLCRLLTHNLAGKSMIDVGTGTGILAILAAMRGAKDVSAIEIDNFAYENAVDNVRINGHGEIDVILGDASALERLAPADILVANINRNIILQDLQCYTQALKPGGMMILSGFYKGNDSDMIIEAAQKEGLMTDRLTASDNNWACLSLIKS